MGNKLERNLLLILKIMINLIHTSLFYHSGKWSQTIKKILLTTLWLLFLLTYKKVIRIQMHMKKTNI